MDLDDIVIRESFPHVLVQDYDGIYVAFLDRLKDKTNISLDNFFRNASTAKVIPVDSKEDMPQATMFAAYNVTINRLAYIRSMFKDTVDHELLHMASTIKGQKYTHCGFSLIDLNNNRVFGEGLNEGYTTLLDERYFSDRTPSKKELLAKTYMLPKLFSEGLENLIGAEIMEKWYFDGDVKSLIEEMCKYVSFNRAIDFIYDLDDMNEYAIHDQGIRGYKEIARAVEDAVSIVTEMALYDAYYNYYSHNIGISDLARIGEAIKESSQMVIGMTVQDGSLRRIANKPMSDGKFKRLAKRVSNSANKNVFKK